MNNIGSFLLQIIENIGKTLAVDLGPYALAEAEALLALGGAVISVWFDSTLSPKEKAELYQDAKNDIAVLIETAKAEGVTLASDLPGILISAGSTSVMGVFGFNTASATIASTPLPQ